MPVGRQGIILCLSGRAPLSGRTRQKQLAVGHDTFRRSAIGTRWRRTGSVEQRQSEAWSRVPTFVARPSDTCAGIHDSTAGRAESKPALLCPGTFLVERLWCGCASVVWHDHISRGVRWHLLAVFQWPARCRPTKSQPGRGLLASWGDGRSHGRSRLSTGWRLAPGLSGGASKGRNVSFGVDK
jgi:hypothetical protein